MAEYCTCGAELPPDARFCHKCGKPQRDEPLSEEVLPAEPLPPPAPPAVDISFRNRTAVRVGLLVAVLALLLSSIPISPFLPFFWMLGAGVLSVYLYNRRSGQRLSVRNGLRIGWMTGVLSFAISMVLITVGMVLLAGRREQWAQALREQSKLPQDMTERALEILSSPGDLLVSLAMGFVMFSLLAALGGALGARVFNKS